jgi:hypothetical protein
MNANKFSMAMLKNIVYLGMENQEEIWKDIAGYEGYYQVSSSGNVRSLDIMVNNKHSQRLRKGRVLRPGTGNSGYYFVNLSKKQAHKCKDVHRLVALEFLGYENSHLTVNHKDGNKLNNNLDNLEFITQSANNWHKIKVLGKGLNRDNRGAKNPMFGRKHSEETLAKLRRPKSAETRKKLSESRIRLFQLRRLEKCE